MKSNPDNSPWAGMDIYITTKIFTAAKPIFTGHELINSAQKAILTDLVTMLEDPQTKLTRSKQSWKVSKQSLQGM